jgi:hypothetical protein
MRIRLPFLFLAASLLLPLTPPKNAIAQCEVVDPPAEVRVTFDDAFFSDKPQIGWTDASTFGVTWMDVRSGLSTRLFYNTVDNSGQIGPVDFQVTDDEAQVSVLSSVWAGNQFGTCWQDNRNGDFETYFTRYDAAGIPTATDVRITNVAGYTWYPRIDWNGTDFGIVFQDNRDGQHDIYFTAVDSSGNKLFPEKKITNTTAVCTFPDLSWDGSNYGVVWEDHQGSSPQVYFAKIDSNGDPVVAPKQIVDSPESSGIPRIAAFPGGYAVVWEDERDLGIFRPTLYYTLLDANGDVLFPETNLSLTDREGRSPEIIWTGTFFGVVWADFRDFNFEIYFQALTQNGLFLGTPLRISDHVAESDNPTLAWSGSEFGIAWGDDRDRNIEIYFSMVQCTFEDRDGDTISDLDDNCPDTPNTDQQNSDTDLLGDVCDNCDFIDNPDQADFDLDVIGDLCDDDKDGDDHDDTTDCDDWNDQVFGHPGEILPVIVSKPVNHGTYEILIEWDDVQLLYGPETVIDILYGPIATLQDPTPFTQALCLAPGLATSDHTDTESIPGSEPGFYYLARARNSCSTGTYGNSSPPLDYRDTSINTAGGDPCP